MAMLSKSVKKKNRCYVCSLTVTLLIAFAAPYLATLNYVDNCKAFAQTFPTGKEWKEIRLLVDTDPLPFIAIKR